MEKKDFYLISYFKNTKTHTDISEKYNISLLNLWKKKCSPLGHGFFFMSLMLTYISNDKW